MEVLGVVAKDVFLYNRENFMFNKEVDMNRVFQLMKMRIEACDLYREDLRDLFDLTVVKMDTYLIVNSLTLIFTMGFFYEGRLPPDTPAWLMWLWATNLVAAVLFLVLSVWFAIHAAIAAQTFAVRLLTQWLRLPVPTRADIEAVKPTLEQFERSKLQDMLRLPVLSQYLAQAVSGRSQQQQQQQQTEETEQAQRSAVRRALEQQYTEFVEHFLLFQRLQTAFSGYDAYTRVTLVVGAAHLFFVVAYMAIAHYLLALQQIGALAFVVGIIAFSIVHARHNLILTVKEHALFAAVLALGPILASVMAVARLNNATSSIPDYLAPFAFLAHLVVTLSYVLLGFEATNELPTRFSTVVAIDVLGEHEDHDAAPQDAPEEPRSLRLQFFSRRRRPGTLAGARRPVTTDSAIREALRKARQASSVDSALGGHVVPTAGPSATLPWSCFRVAGFAVLAVWLASVVWAALAAFGVSIWRWDSVIQDTTRPVQLTNQYLTIPSTVVPE